MPLEPTAPVSADASTPRRALWLASGRKAAARDAFLVAALAQGADEAVWFDLAGGWGERYRTPALLDSGDGDEEGDRPGAPTKARFRERSLVWPGDVLAWSVIPPPNSPRPTRFRPPRVR